MTEIVGTEAIAYNELYFSDAHAAEIVSTLKAVAGNYCWNPVHGGWSVREGETWSCCDEALVVEEVRRGLIHNYRVSQDSAEPGDSLQWARMMTADRIRGIAVLLRGVLLDRSDGKDHTT